MTCVVHMVEINSLICFLPFCCGRICDQFKLVRGKYNGPWPSRPLYRNVQHTERSLFVQYISSGHSFLRPNPLLTPHPYHPSPSSITHSPLRTVPESSPGKHSKSSKTVLTACPLNVFKIKQGEYFNISD